jgi:alpha/beta superfamily hydrolase
MSHGASTLCLVARIAHRSKDILLLVVVVAKKNLSIHQRTTHPRSSRYNVISTQATATIQCNRVPMIEANTPNMHVSVDISHYYHQQQQQHMTLRYVAIPL